MTEKEHTYNCLPSWIQLITNYRRKNYLYSEKPRNTIEYYGAIYQQTFLCSTVAHIPMHPHRYFTP